MSPIVRSTVETTTTTRYCILGKEILALVPGILPDDDVWIEFKVPSGGDYSGQWLDITEENPVIVTVKRRTTDTEER